MKLTNQFVSASKSAQSISDLNDKLEALASTPVVPLVVRIFGSYERGIRKALKAGQSQTSILRILQANGVAANVKPSTAAYYMSDFVRNHMTRASV